MKKMFLFVLAAAALAFVSCKSTAVEDSDLTNSLVDEQIQEEIQETVEDVVEEIQEEIDNTDALAQAEEARKQAVASGADKTFAEAFQLTDKAFEALKALDDGKDHNLEYSELAKRYDALAKACEALKLKERIDTEDLSSNDINSYNKGEAAKKDFESMMTAAPGSLLLPKANEMYDSYRAVYLAAYKKFANAERKEAVAQKKNADAVKAQIARKDEYKADADFIIKGDSEYATGNPEAALADYKEAKEKFKALAEDVAAKRAAAQKAIDEAKAKVESVEEFAVEADKEKPLGDEKIDGIEEEGTVLLEADTFENPEEKIIVIEEEAAE